jgi:hypothetical protein
LPRVSKLEPFKGKVDGLLAAGVWNAAVILRELQSAGYRQPNPAPGARPAETGTAICGLRCVSRRSRGFNADGLGPPDRDRRPGDRGALLREHAGYCGGSLGAQTRKS